MTNYIFSQRSLDNLNGVHPDLLACVVCALYKHTTVDFSIICGVRTWEQQKKEVEEGNSWTMKSKHLLQQDGFAHAVDLAPYIGGTVPWKDLHSFRLVKEAMFKSADELGIKLKWGGDWKNKTDMPHYYIESKRI